VFPKQNYRGKQRFWYTGAGMGFMAHYLRFPDDDLSILTFGNNSTNRGWNFAIETVPKIADIYLGLAAKETEPLETSRPKNNVAIQLNEKRIKELEQMVGVVRRSKGNFAELHVRHGQLFLHEFTSHWKYGHQEPLITLSENRFRTQRGYQEFELKFDTDRKGDDLEMVDESRPFVCAEYKNGDIEVWSPVKLTEYSTEELQPFAGEYYSDDLEAVHIVTASKNQLFVQYNCGRKRAHRPTENDTFVPISQQFCIPVKFHRNKSGSVRGFTMEFDRSGEVYFSRRKSIMTDQDKSL
ncbi:MAG: hypothetical protein AAF497_21595, partial [Planctomycetota bacterium]